MSARGQGQLAAVDRHDEAVDRSDPSRLDWLRGGLLAAGGMTMQALPVELLTPVVRVVRGRHGVQFGPTAAALLIPVINVSASRRALSKSVPQGSRPGRALDVVALVLPTLAAVTPATVVLRARSPLWA